MLLEDILKNEFLGFIPFQDKNIVAELIVTSLEKANEITLVRCAYFTEKYSKINCTTNLDLQDKLKNYFASSFNASLSKDIKCLNENSNSIFVPFFMQNSLYLVLELHIEGNTNNRNILRQLDNISFFCSILFDRIEYAQELQRKNKELESANKTLKNANEKLTKDLKLAIKDFHDQAELARVVSEKVSNDGLSKELIHEVNNPLSLIQFDLFELQNICNQFIFHEDVIENVSRFYKIDFNFVKNKISSIDASCNKTISNQLNSIKKYPVFAALFNFQYILLRLKNLAGSSIRNIENISTLIEAVSQSGIITQNEFEVLDVRSAIDDVMKLFENKLFIKNIKFKVSGKLNLYFIKVSKIRMSQVLINVIMNSLKALEFQEKKTIDIQIKKLKNYIVISILDSGPGFDSTYFDYNLSSKSKNARIGLGLLICKNILSQINGEIKFYRQHNKTRVDICVPNYTKV